MIEVADKQFSDTSVESNDPALDATEVRFSIRALLIVTACVAVGTTALGAFLRQFPKEAQLRLLLYWGLLAIILIMLILYHAWRRRTSERQAGRTHFVLTRYNYFLPRSVRWATIIPGTLLLLVAPLYWAYGSFSVAENKPGAWSNAFNWPAIYSVAMCGSGLTLLWWRRVKLTENGVLIRNRFVPWGNCTRWYWDACNKHVIVIQMKTPTRMAARTSPEDRDGIESLLRYEVAERPAKPSTLR
jgi:hypothetical protein